MKAKVNKSTTIEEKLPLKAKKTDHNIPVFGVKSALVILLFAVLGSYVAPMIISLVGISKDIAVVIGNTLVTPLGICFARFFIETKKGYCKNFLYLYLAFGAIAMLISSYWMVKGIYL